MPEISRFMGMVIQLYYDDHLVPHIHVRQAESRCRIDLNGILLDGNISLHHSELLKNWKRIRNGKQPERIEPWI